MNSVITLEPLMNIEYIEGTIAVGVSPDGTPHKINFYINEQMWEQSGLPKSMLIEAGTSELLEAFLKAFQIFSLEN